MRDKRTNSEDRESYSANGSWRLSFAIKDLMRGQMAHSLFTNIPITSDRLQASMPHCKHTPVRCPYNVQSMYIPKNKVGYALNNQVWVQKKSDERQNVTNFF